MVIDGYEVFQSFLVEIFMAVMYLVSSTLINMAYITVIPPYESEVSSQAV